MVIQLAGADSGAELTASYNLSNFYARYLKSGDLAGVIREMVRGFHESQPHMPVIELSDVRDQVLPILKPAEYLEGAPEAVTQPYPAGLRIAYVIDNPTTIRFIMAHDLATWQIDRAELHDLALNNLRALAHSTQPQRIDMGEGSLTCCASGDGFDAARILVPEVVEAWVLDPQRQPAAGPPPPVVIAIPHRDMLAATIAYPSVISLMKMVISQFYQPPHQLSTALFTIHNGQIVPY